MYQEAILIFDHLRSNLDDELQLVFVREGSSVHYIMHT